MFFCLVDFILFPRDSAELMLAWLCARCSEKCFVLFHRLHRAVVPASWLELVSCDELHRVTASRFVLINCAIHPEGGAPHLLGLRRIAATVAFRLIADTKIQHAIPPLQIICPLVPGFFEMLKCKILTSNCVKCFVSSIYVCIKRHYYPFLNVLNGLL